jgi:hypothetical protein
MSSIDFGDNGHPQYTWLSTYWEDTFVKLSFQLVRNASPTLIKTVYNSLILNALNTVDPHIRTYRLSLLFKIMAHTRDICDGKGERELFYILFKTWLSYPQSMPILSKFLHYLFNTTEIGHPYGSWKDFKYLYSRCYTHYPNSPIIHSLLALTASQIKKDINKLNTTASISLCARWIPREKSKPFGWIAPALATHIFPHLSKNTSSSKRYLMQQYRTTVTTLNKALHTVQIYQCQVPSNWASIDFTKHVSSITMHRQKNAFTAANLQTTTHDRLICSQHYHNYISSCIHDEHIIPFRHVSLYELIKSANKLINKPLDDIQRKTISLQWTQGSKLHFPLTNCIPFLDISASMITNTHSFFTAIGIALRIAELSTINKRLITYSALPTWLDLSDSVDLVSMIDKIHSIKHDGLNSNLLRAVDFLAKSCAKLNMTSNEVSGLTLIILSDMQSDRATSSLSFLSSLSSSSQLDTLEQNIHHIFAQAGCTSSYAAPYSSPHIIFWNMRQTNGFPTTPLTKNTTMVSGYSTSILTTINKLITERANKITLPITHITPWYTLCKTLSNKRYAWLDSAISLCK